MASATARFEGSWRTELAELKKGMDKIALKTALRPLSGALATSALGLAVERASKLAPASTMYSRSNASSFRVGTTQVGAAAHQFGATIRPRAVKENAENGRRLAMIAARGALAHLGSAEGKTRAARQLVRRAGVTGFRAALADAPVAFLTFMVGGRWVRVRQVKLPKRPIFPLDGIPSSWEDRFQQIADVFFRRLLS